MSTRSRRPRALEALAPVDRLCCAAGERLRCLAASFAFFLFAAIALGQETVHPLKPSDRSSPRATLKSFLDSSDAVAEFLAREYLPSTSHAKFQRLLSLAEIPQQYLDLSEVPPAARQKTGRLVAADLYEILNRIPLPPLDEIADAGQVKEPAGTGPTRWVIPNTEIALVRAQSGPRSGEFLFSADTVDRAGDFYERVRGLPYVRPVLLENVPEIFSTGGGWMVPYAWVQAMPASLRAPLAGQAGWKWIGLALILLVFALFLWSAYRLSQLGRAEHPFLRALAQFAMPASVLLATPVVAYFALVQLNLIGTVGSAIDLAATAVTYVAGAWMVWRLAPVAAEAIIASPSIAPESIDAHLIRVAARLLGIAGSVALLALGADRLGVPMYGIVAGLGVGGLAIALAAQPTIENLIGGMNLFADKPMRVGDLCMYGGEIGTVEGIGIRSTRIRGLDRTLTTIPNGALARMPIVNFTQRDRMLIKAVIGVRYETSPEQLRYLLVKLREVLLGHPRVDPDPARARLVGFGASSLDIEVFAYATTRDWNEFLGIREDVLLRVMDVIEQAGASIAFPSQTLYLGRDRGSDDGKARAAEASVREWRDQGALPFPTFSPEQAGRIRGSIVFPPPGSTAASAAGSGSDTGSPANPFPAEGATDDSRTRQR